MKFSLLMVLLFGVALSVHAQDEGDYEGDEGDYDEGEGDYADDEGDAEAEEGEEADMEKRGGLEVAKRPLPAALGLAVKYGPAAYKAGRFLYK